MKLTQASLHVLYPRLLELPEAERAAVLDRARDSAFDVLEFAGVVAGVAFAAWLLGARFQSVAAQSPLLAYLFRFALALPLLTLLVGPLYVRRTRRGLARELDCTRRGVVNSKVLSDRKEA